MGRCIRERRFLKGKLGRKSDLKCLFCFWIFYVFIGSYGFAIEDIIVFNVNGLSKFLTR